MSRLQRARRKTISLFVAFGVSVSVLLFGGLYIQMASGNDPVLGYKKVIAVRKAPPVRNTPSAYQTSLPPSPTVDPYAEAPPTPQPAAPSTYYQEAPQPEPVVSTPS